MAERPILFSGPMVRAILEGRKTQTRRVVKHQPPSTHVICGINDLFWIEGRNEPGGCPEMLCPYGAPGDTLYVRETWATGYGKTFYRATDDLSSSGMVVPWKPSIHMPREMSRLTLEVTGVRVEPLRCITSKDILAEGAVSRPHMTEHFGKCPVSAFDGKCYTDLQSLWATGWNSICKLDGTKYRGIDLLTGGFPCQPYSCEGKRKGSEDDRALWPDLFRVISQSGPRWVIGENVDGLDGLGLDDCISDLEAIGYEVAPPLEIPAGAVGATHERNRIWIVAHSNSDGLQGRVRRNQEAGQRRCKHSSLLPALPLASRTDELPSPRTTRGNDGILARAHRIKSLGNAIVPQVAFQIIKAIAQIDGGTE